MTQPNTPPTRSKVAGALAALACAACCAIPWLIAAGVLSAAGAAVLQQTLIAVAALLAVAALGMWWLHRRRQIARARRATAPTPVALERPADLGQPTDATAKRAVGSKERGSADNRSEAASL